MRRFTFVSYICGCWLALWMAQVRAEGLAESKSRFYYKDSSGKTASARIVRRYWRVPIVHPFARVDRRIDPKMRRAATIAEERANAHSKAHCWQSVKEALVASGAINSYPKTAYACQAGEELARNYGFKRLFIRDPYKAPLGAVLVYGNVSRGHVEIRAKDGFVSDYRSKYRCRCPLLAVYGKFSS